MMKINSRSNSYVENKPKKLYNTNDRAKVYRKIADDNLRLYENLQKTKPTVSRTEWEMHEMKMNHFRQYFKHFD